MSDPLSIAFLTPEYVTEEHSDGGLANYLQKVGSELSARGHGVTVFVWSARNAEWNDGQVRVVEVKVPGPFPFRKKAFERFEPGIRLYRSAKKLEKALLAQHKLRPFDVVQVSSYKAPGFTLRRNHQFPLVCRVSSYTPLLRSTHGLKRGFAEYLTDWLEIRQVLDADSAFAPSRFVAQIFEKMEGVRLKLLRSPIIEQQQKHDPRVFESQLAGKSYVLFFGTLSRIKGADLFAEAIPQVWKQNPDIHFVFAGRDDGLPETIHGKVKTASVMSYIREYCNADERIHYLGVLNSGSLRPIIERALCVALPSRVDNYPNACLEAHSFGIPVIGTRDSSLDEIIEDGATGLLIRNGEAVELANAIIKIASMSADQMQNMKNRILEHVESVRAEDRIGQLIELYRDTMEQFNAKFPMKGRTVIQKS